MTPAHDDPGFLSTQIQAAYRDIAAHFPTDAKVFELRSGAGHVFHHAMVLETIPAFPRSVWLRAYVMRNKRTVNQTLICPKI